MSIYERSLLSKTRYRQAKLNYPLLIGGVVTIVVLSAVLYFYISSTNNKDKNT